jgi:hypothetical protein
MNEFSHLRTVVAVLVGLALSNLATSVHHLLRERHRVRWDWLAPSTALLSVLLILQFWFSYYDFGKAALLTRLGPVLLLLLELLLVVLLACSALPDGASELDLRRYYADQSRYFWLVASSYVAGAMAWSLWLAPPVGLAARLAALAPDLVFVLLCLLLAVVRRRRLHEVLVPLVCAYYLVGFFDLRINGPAG